MYAAVAKIVVAGIVIAIVKFILGRKPKSENPFSEDGRRPPEPIIREKEKRQGILKKIFSPELVPTNLDAIVIGSGIGGLSCAAVMAKAGKKVLVLEQLKKAGGCTHTFKDKGVEFDVGIHYIGDMMNQTLSKTLIDQITAGQLQWSPLDDAFDVVMIGQPPNQRRYEIASGPGKVDKLKEYFPNETEAIDKFFDVVKTVNKHFLLYTYVIRLFPRPISKFLAKSGLLNFLKWSTYSKTTLKEYLDNLTTNQDLRDVLSYCFGDYGTLPSEGCIGMHAFLWKHFYHTVAYPVGGASEIAIRIIPVIEKAGGKVLTKASVSKIICKDGKAIGVSVTHGTKEVPIYAPQIISNAGVYNTFGKLIPRELGEKCGAMNVMKKMKPAIAGLSVFVNLDGTKEELGLNAQNIWGFTSNDVDKISREYFNKSFEEAKEAEVPLMFLSFPSAKDPTWESRIPDKSSMTLVTLANYKWFENWNKLRVKKRGDEYDLLKKQIGDTMVQQAISYYPHLKDKISNVVVGTPLTNEHYLAAPHGEIYGLDHTAYRFSGEVIADLRPDTEIPGLYLTGQDVLTCGFGGALFGGVLCASSALNRNVLMDLTRLHKKLKS